MFDEEKMAAVRKKVITVFLVFLCLASITISYSLGKSSGIKQNIPKKQEKTEAKSVVTSEMVTTFLLAYYTKKELGENRNRYEPLVTTAMYNQLKKQEEEPVNQAYKGYIVNQVFESADIYINVEKDSAICVVHYKNTQRTKKGTDEHALVNQSNQEAIQLTFQKQGKNYLVDKIDPVTVVTDGYKQENTYNTQVQTTGGESKKTNENGGNEK